MQESLTNKATTRAENELDREIAIMLLKQDKAVASRNELNWQGKKQEKKTFSVFTIIDRSIDRY